MSEGELIYSPIFVPFMKATYINYSDTHSFSSTVLSYLAHDPKLAQFVSHFPRIENFGKLISEKNTSVNRQVLADALTNQYSRLNNPSSSLVNSNINLLRDENTFTVTTGHQLNIFTGPLYFIFKIVTTLNLARELKAAYPSHNFVPVYWMATEDHDFAEINHTTVQDKKISWDLKTSGPTGRINTESILKTVKNYLSVLGLSQNSEELAKIIENAYLKNQKLADATRYLVNSLFEDYGLVIIDADDPQLKKQFAPYIHRDIIEQNSSKAINESSTALKEAGFTTQVNSRDINFFYMLEGLRERIVFENNKYNVVNSEISFNEEELKKEIEDHPCRFSPNVVMRPLYQEVLLPNLAYIGGGAEVTYWLQLKKSFDFYGVTFPILLLRNSALIAHEEFSNKLCRLHICHQELFKPMDEIKRDWVINNSKHNLSLSHEWIELSSIFEKIKLSSYKIDPTLAPSTDAVKVRLQKAINNLEKKLIKADKRNHEEVLNQIENLKKKYFPGGSLQERSENFGSFYVRHGKNFIQSLIAHFKPLDSKFTILEP